MQKNKQKVVIDADFFRHTTDYEIGTSLFETILNDSGYIPVMHEYIYKVELKNNTKLKYLITTGKIEIVKEKDFLNAEEIESYKDFFVQAYNYLNTNPFDGDPMEYGYDGCCFEESLGEIRSIYMAMKLGYEIVLSDDDDSVKLVKFINSKKHSIKVTNLYNMLVSNFKNAGNLRWKDLRVTVPKVFNNRQRLLDKLVELYCNEEDNI